MNLSFAVRVLLPLLLISRLALAESYLVENGVPRSEIIIAEEPPRTTRMAARELQQYLQKITGARLEIVTEPTGNVPVRILVGNSPGAAELGVTADDLKYGAYRIVSGDDWIVFIGDDTDFVPIEPWPRSNNDLVSGKMQAEWDAITGRQWGYMHSQLHKHYTGPNSLFGTPDERKTDDDGNVHVWTYDERGSFNAVCGFLRDLGVRWYMPGEIGEVLPEMESIELPAIDRTVHPDFPMRILNFRAIYGHDVSMWSYRLGVRQPYGRQAAHGLHGMTDNERTLKNHPDWFALYGGKRQNDPRIGNNQLCYSNEELFREAVEFARVQLDHFDMDVVSIMPPDGYTAICQCEKCAGKESPELGARGMLSNYVWDFVNRVAKEVGKTHPNKRISNCAYGIYTEPPSNIEKLEPNVQVIIVGGRRPTSDDRDDLRRLRAAWQEKTDNPIEIFENYPFTGRGFYLPAYIPHVLGESINETKGQSRGEDIWLTMDFGEDAVGYNHFLIYFTARMYWGGKDQDPGALFDEYVEKFYGPAAPAMDEFFAYCEEHWREMEHDSEIADHALALFAAARTTVSSDSIYGRRIELIDNYLNGLRNKAKQLAQKRGPVPSLRLVSGVSERGDIVVDGKLDDEAWVNIPVASTGSLRELQTGRLPTFGTSFMAEMIGNDLYFAIRCEDHPGEQLNIATDKDGDQAIWYGDVVEIELATDMHSYYQLAISPAGALVDLDRGAPRNQWFNWSSKAEVATQIHDDHWIVEVRLPVTNDENDPLNQVVGNRPTQSLPWFFNVCRQRIRENGSEFSAFSPTGTSGFHVPMKFAHFYAGRSHQFPADPTVTDYLIASRAAEELQRTGNHDEALAAFVALSEGENVTDFQVSDALQHAAACARSLEDFERAEELTVRIPIESVAKTERMRNLLAKRDWAAVIEEFKAEDFSQWPFWQIGDGAQARGRAYFILKQGPEAESDLQTALEFSPDWRSRMSILLMLGNNREHNLQDEEGALAAYRRNFESTSDIGAADEFRSVQGAVRILTRRGEYEAALAVLDRVEIDERTGYWRHEMLLSRAQTLIAAGRKDAALEAYRAVLNDESASGGHRRSAEQAIRKIEEPQ